MVSKRIRFIASLINKDDKVLDVGTDHALLPIYLIKNNITNIADGSDISKEVLKNAESNINKYNLEDKINLYLSDGIHDVDVSKYDTLVITGMGFYTIKGILENANLQNISKMIIQSNNNHEELRRFVNKIGYKINTDRYILDKDKSYLIIEITKGNQILTDQEYICGTYNEDNIWYYKYITNKYKEILNNIPGSDNEVINEHLKYFNSYLVKEKTED